MDQGTIINILGRFFLETIIVSTPVLLIALITGLIIAVFQTVTSIQEQTLSFVPKLIAIFLVLLVSGTWILKRIAEFSIYLISNMGG